MKLPKLANPIFATRAAIGLAGRTVRATGAGAAAATRVLLPGAPDEAPEETAQAAEPAREPAGVPAAPTAVIDEPHPPAEPPVDVVGEALAAEEAGQDGAAPLGSGFAHEPRGASRDEEHGEAALQRAEVDELAEEASGALEDEATAALDDAPEAGSEEHLSEPLLDPGDAGAVLDRLRTPPGTA